MNTLQVLSCLRYSIHRSYLVLCVISLFKVSFETTKNQCPGSYLWMYLLICQFRNLSIILNFKKGKQINHILLVFDYLLTLIFTAWGYYELWGRQDYKNLEKLNIYNISKFQFVISFVECITITFIFYSYGIGKYFNKIK